MNNKTILTMIIIIFISYLGFYNFGYMIKESDYPNLITLVLILSFLLSGFFGRRFLWGEIFKQISMWVIIFFISIACYSYRFEFYSIYNRIFSYIIPSNAIIGDDYSVTVHISDNGHFMIDSKIDNIPVMFLLDTGSSAIVLNKNDAIRVGIDIENLKYDIPVSTANGLYYAARAKLSYIEVGSIKINDIDALINLQLDTSLLGMSFLNKLKKYEVYDDMIIFHAKGL